MLHFFASWIFHILCRERENISYRVVSFYFKNGKIWKWFLSFNAIQLKWEMLTLYHDYKSSLDYEIFLLYLHEFLMIFYYSNKARIWIVYLNNIKISKRSIMNKPKMSYGCERLGFLGLNYIMEEIENCVSVIDWVSDDGLLFLELL